MWLVVLLATIVLFTLGVQSAWSYLFAPRAVATVWGCEPTLFDTPATTACYADWEIDGKRFDGRIDGVDEGDYANGTTFIGYLQDDTVRPVSSGPRWPAYVLGLAVLAYLSWLGTRVRAATERRRRGEASVPAGELVPISFGLGLPAVIVGVMLMCFVESRLAGAILAGAGLLVLVPPPIWLILAIRKDDRQKHEAGYER